MIEPEVTLGDDRVEAAGRYGGASSKLKTSDRRCSVKGWRNLATTFWLANMPFSQKAWSRGRVSIQCTRARYSLISGLFRSEERRVGKECRSRWSPYH